MSGAVELEAELRAASQELDEANIVVDNLVAIVDANVKRAEAAEVELATLRSDNERLGRELTKCENMHLPEATSAALIGHMNCMKAFDEMQKQKFAAEAERDTLLAQVGRLREIISRYGNRMRMSYAPAHLQQDIDDAFTAETRAALTKEPSASPLGEQ